MDAASWQTRGKRDAGQKKQGFGGGAATGRTLERRVGRTRQKIAAPPPLRAEPSSAIWNKGRMI